MKIVKTKTADNLHLHGLLSTPTHISKKIIIHIHGMAGSPLLNSYYPAMHEQYSQNDIAFLAVEHRGTGTITSFCPDNRVRVIGNAFEVFEECIFDIEAWVQFAQAQGFEEIWLQAHSLGTSKVAYYFATKKPTAIAGLLLLSPSDMIGLVHDEDGAKDHAIMLPQAQKLMSEGKATTLIDHQLWGELYLSAKTYLNFFDESAQTAIFNFNDDSLGWHTVRAITIPVLAITGTKDFGIVPVMDPRAAMKKLEAELINSPRVTTVVIENAEHSFDGFANEIIRAANDFVSAYRI